MKIRNIYFTVLAAGAFTLPLHSALASHDIQMLPPVQFDNITVCNSSSPQLLAWDGQTSIKCIPNVTADLNGNVGIGRQNPQAPLDVFGANTGVGMANQNGAIALVEDGNYRPAITVYGDIDGAALADNTASALAVRDVNGTGRSITTSGEIYAGGNPGVGLPSIITNGWVGIMTTHPQAQLDVNGYLRVDDTAGILIYGSTPGNYGGHEAVMTVSGGVGTDSDEIWIGPNTSGYVGHVQLVASDINLSASTVYVRGNLGMGTLSPAAQLDMTGNALIRTSLAVGRSSANPSNYLTVGDDGTVPPANTFAYFANNGGGYSLVGSRILATTFFNAPAYWINGTCQFGNCASDIRLKDHVRPFKPGLDALLDINPVYYRLTGQGGLMKSDHDAIGVIAQDVEKGAPELITPENVRMNPGDVQDTEIKKVNYTGLQYVLINAVKEFYGRWSKDSDALRTKIDGIKTDNDNLRTLVNAQGREIEELKAEIKTAKETK